MAIVGQDLLQDGLEAAYEQTIGQYTDPANIALTLALKKYLPRMAAMLGLLESINFWWLLLAPSPIANDFTQARPENDEIQRRLQLKLMAHMSINWKTQYRADWEKTYLIVRPGGLL